MTNKPNVEEFKKFVELLMKSAPEGYKPHFLRLEVNGKNPIENFGWKNKPISYELALDWMKNHNGNVGIVGRVDDPLVNVDLDGEEVNKDELKPTLTTRSRSRTGIHGFYFTENKQEIPNINTDDNGEVRCQNEYVVCAGSYVTTSPDEVPEQYRETAGYYTIEDTNPPCYITYNDLPKFFREKHEKALRDEEEAKNRPKSDFNAENLKGPHSAVFDVTPNNIIKKLVGPKRKNDRWGSIFHDSETEANMCIDSGLLHCWRHGVSHNGLQALTVLSGYMTCEQAGSPHKGNTGVSKIIGDFGAIFHAWKYAKENELIPANDPIPVKAMLYLAKENGLIEENDDNMLSWQKYNKVLEIVKTQFNLDSGRTPLSEPVYREIEKEGFEKLKTAKELIRIIFTDLSRRVKHDDTTKASVFISGVSSFGPEPLNLFEKGQSGSGKTYNAIETLKYFSEQNIFYLAGMSPKAIVHQKGVLMDKDGIEISDEDFPEKPNRADFRGNLEGYKTAKDEYKIKRMELNERLKGSYNYINISNQILVFLETPHEETIKMLYPILSHDKDRVEYRFVNKTGQGKLKTDKVVIEGFPASIFLTTEKKYIEEIATRSFTTSPDSNSEKIQSANKLTNMKMATPWLCETETPMYKAIKELLYNIEITLKTKKVDVIIPFTNLHEEFSNTASRDMRDFDHFKQFTKAWVITHIYQRPTITIHNKTYILANLYDVICCKKIFEQLLQTTQTGTEKRILDFYRDCMLTGQESYTVTELLTKFNETQKTKISDFTIRKWLTRLNVIGYVEKREDPNDKRKNNYVPIMLEKEKLENTCDLKKHVSLALEMEKGFKKWLEIIRNESYQLKRNFFINEDISLEELSSLILTDKNSSILFADNVFTIFKDVDFIRFKENKPKNVCKRKKHVFSRISDEEQQERIKKKQEEQRIIQEAERNDKELEANTVRDGKYIVCFNCKKTVTDPTKLRRLDNQFYCVTCRDAILKGRNKVKEEKNPIDEIISKTEGEN
ncbi:MAG: bifunctional DNA primase/polymerase [Candidatus Bathyarchaeota archaeon]|nr:bifunctional DNA primase/polymerase [Candidatus Bathyarchaeum tardum]